MMKNSLYFFSFLLLTSCTPHDISGKWKVVDFQAKTTEFEQSYPQSGIDRALSTTYLFNQDSTFILNSDLFDHVTGTYQITRDSLILTHPLGGRPMKLHYALNKLGSEEIRLEQKIGGLEFYYTLKRD